MGRNGNLLLFLAERKGRMIFLKTIGDTVPNPYQSAMTEIERREFLRESLKTTGAALAGVGVLTSASCNRQSAEPQSSDCVNPTRAELVKRLQKLAESEPPPPVVCTCYEPAPPPEVKKKPCPACERTMIVGQMDEILRAYNVPLKRIRDQGVNATLIVPEYCPQCGFGLMEEKIQLEIKYPDKKEPTVVELNEALDLEIMALFLQGEKSYDASSLGPELPLKNKVDRLRELFGVKE